MYILLYIHIPIYILYIYIINISYVSIGIIHRPKHISQPGLRLPRCPTCQGPPPMGPMASTCPGDASELLGFQIFTQLHPLLSATPPPHGKRFQMRPPRKIHVGFAKDSRKYFVYSRRMAVCRSRNLEHRQILFNVSEQS